MFDYRLAPALAARILGVSFAALALLVFLATFLVAALGGSFVWVALLAAVGLVVTGVTAYVVTKRIAVLHVDDAGYRVRLIRGAGVRTATWDQVKEIAEVSGDDGRFLLFKLADGARTSVPFAALAASPAEVTKAVRRAVKTARRGPS